LKSWLVLHDLRHAAASRLINAGLDPVTVATVLGHEDATLTLKVYGHLWDRQRTDDDDVRKPLAGRMSIAPLAAPGDSIGEARIYCLGECGRAWAKTVVGIPCTPGRPGTVAARRAG
jgi:hypothetical protein